MAVVDLIMPKLGESIMEATILKWHKQPGDTVKLDETVLEIATDKVDSEVPSTAEGVITEILYNVDDVVPIGSVIARISTEAEAAGTGTPSTPVTTTAPETKPAPVATAAVTEPQPVRSAPAPVQSNAGNVQVGRFYSPLVLNIAASEGISMSELERIPGNGTDGRVTKKICWPMSPTVVLQTTTPPIRRHQPYAKLLQVLQKLRRKYRLPAIPAMWKSWKWTACAA
ncbi:MAG: E3 binding domain-containing protein [Chitinophagaceae bacterium]|nr:E3 binding domain-containing protein [Chitinophagaceae bacterium]